MGVKGTFKIYICFNFRTKEHEVIKNNNIFLLCEYTMYIEYPTSNGTSSKITPFSLKIS